MNSVKVGSEQRGRGDSSSAGGGNRWERGEGEQKAPPGFSPSPGAPPALPGVTPQPHQNWDLLPEIWGDPVSVPCVSFHLPSLEPPPGQGNSSRFWGSRSGRSRELRAGGELRAQLPKFGHRGGFWLNAGGDFSVRGF